MFYRNFLKRVFDIISSFLGIVFLLPVFIVIGLIIKFTSKGPIIFKHKRLGKDCKVIQVFKFRTMVDNAINLGPEYTISNDNRITKIGKVLRKYSLDELPQLFNVFLGEMSLIGPRPDAYSNNPTEFQIFRTKILPGITGLAQVEGRSALTVEEKQNYDRQYVENYSLKMDIKILLKTIQVVLLKKGVN